MMRVAKTTTAVSSTSEAQQKIWSSPLTYLRRLASRTIWILRRSKILHDNRSILLIEN